MDADGRAQTPRVVNDLSNKMVYRKLKNDFQNALFSRVYPKGNTGHLTQSDVTSVLETLGYASIPKPQELIQSIFSLLSP